MVAAMSLPPRPPALRFYRAPIPVGGRQLRPLRLKPIPLLPRQPLRLRPAVPMALPRPLRRPLRRPRPAVLASRIPRTRRKQKPIPKLTPTPRPMLRLSASNGPSYQTLTCSVNGSGSINVNGTVSFTAAGGQSPYVFNSNASGASILPKTAPRLRLPKLMTRRALTPRQLKTRPIIKLLAAR